MSNPHVCSGTWHVQLSHQPSKLQLLQPLSYNRVCILYIYMHTPIGITLVTDISEQIHIVYGI